jgi:ribosomal protein S18 acetylase RimI-like enzyme
LSARPIAVRAFATGDAEQADLLDRLCRANSGYQIFVAAIGAESAGFVSLSLDHTKKIGEIGLHAVHPTYAGQGIGTQLYAFAVSLMRDRGMQLATVGTGGDPSHEAARRAYRKAGFEVGLPSVSLYKLL